MNSKERVITALNRKQPDRVPIFELLINPSVREKIYPGCSYLDFAEKIGLDIVITDTPSSLYRQKKISEDLVETEWREIRKVSKKEMVSIPIKGPIENEKDLQNYTPPDPLDPYRYEQLNCLVKRFKGKKAIAMHLHDAFSYPTYLRGMANLLMDLILNPSLVKKLVKISVEHTKKIIKKAFEIGVEIIVFGDDYASTTAPLISPQHFKEFFSPAIKELVEEVKKNGGYVIKHTDGNIKPILDMLIETGIDGLHPLDPIAGMDIKEVKEKYKDKICVIGNVDTTEVLTNWSPEKVKENVKELILKVAPGGGYIISSSNSIHSQVKPENYLAMIEAVKTYGNYSCLGGN